MTYAMTKQQFAGKLKTIGGSRKALSGAVQAALIAAAYFAIADRNATPFAEILKAVGTTAHRQGITQWAETYAPVLFRNEGFKLNAPAYQGLDVEAIKADFDKHVRESGMDAVRWDTIAKNKNKAESVFSAESRVNKLLKDLEANGLGGLAAHITKAVEEYNAEVVTRAALEKLTAGEEYTPAE